MKNFIDFWERMRNFWSHARWILFVFIFLLPMIVSAEQPARSSDKDSSSDEDSVPKKVTLRYADFMGKDSFFFEEIIQPWGERIDKQASHSLPLIYHTTTTSRDDPIRDIERRRYDVVRLTPSQTIQLFPALEVFQLPFIGSNAYITSRAMQTFVEEQEANFQGLSVIPLLTFSDGYGMLQMTAKNPSSDVPFESRQLLSTNRIMAIFLNALGSDVSLVSPFSTKQQIENSDIDGILASGFYHGSIRDSIARYYNFGKSYNPSSNPYMVLLSRDVYLNLHPLQQRAITNHSRTNFAIWVGKRFDLGYDSFLSEARSDGKFHLLDEETLKMWQGIGINVTRAWVESMAKREMQSEIILTRARQLLQKYARQ